MTNNTFKQTEIGEIPEDWKILSVKDLVAEEVLEAPMDGNHGSIHPKSSDYVDEGVPFLMATDLESGIVNYSECKHLSEETSKKLRKGFAQPKDVLLSHKATIGRTAVLDDTFEVVVLTPQLTYYRVKNYQSLNNYFLKYYFDSPYFQRLFKSWSGGGSTRAYLGITKQLKLPILLPQISEQHEIVNIVKSLDDKIELNRRMNKTLEEIGKALFKQWFVDFEFPFDFAQGKPNLNGEPYKSSGGEMVESELGEIPKGWKVEPLADVYDFLEGPGIRNWQYSEEGTRFINIRLINNGDIDVLSSNFINQDDVDNKYQHFLLDEGDMVVSTSGTLGRSAIVRKSHLPLLLNTSVIRFRPKQDVGYAFMYLYLQSEEFLNEQIRLSSGSVQKNFGPTHLKQMKIILPKKSLLDLFNTVGEGLYKQIIANMNESEILSKLRDSLLPRLMSGKIRVS